MLTLKRKFCLVLFLLALGSWGVLPAEAASLFQPNGSLANLFADYKARQVGDTVTIIISEVATSSQQASTSSGKTNNLSANDFQVGANQNNTINNFFKNIVPISAKTSSKFTGDGSTSRSGSLSARMTAVVTEVLPNGNLVIEGSQRINVNGENQEIYVKGHVRPADITSENTVLSTMVANAEIKYKGKGTIGETQKPGLLTQFFHWLF